MLSIASSRITSWLVRAGAVAEKDRELYEYAVYSFLFSCIPLLLAICIGATLDMLVEGLLIIIPFMLIRKFSGGFHLNSSVVCFVSSLALLTLSFLLTKLLYLLEWNNIFSFFVFLSSVQIFYFSPIDSKARTLSQIEMITFKGAARLLLLLTDFVYLLSILGNMERYAIPIGMGILITGLLQLPCIITFPQNTSP